MTQTGSNNVLIIEQNGDAGSIGATDGVQDYHWPDTPPHNFSISFNGVNQTSTGAGSNKATLTQGGTAAVIGDLQQTANGSAIGNNITVDQGGTNNVVNHIKQQQDTASTNNVATVTENGASNEIDRIDQLAHGTASSGDPNTINLTIDGNNNGYFDGSPTTPFYDTFAYAYGATPSALIQNHYNSSLIDVAGNSIDLIIHGDNNGYGQTQKGTDNSSGTVTINGSNNSFGTYQAGNANTIQAGEVDGDFNDIGIWQSGDTNVATVSVLATGSDYNQIGIAQGGTDNHGTVSVTGTGNTSILSQAGTSNTADIEINGDDNGNGAFSGAAGTLATSASLANGTVIQGTGLGSANNTANLTIFGDSNDFTIAQLGSDNQVTGNIGSGLADSSNNQAAVLQTGDGNIASFSQSGAGSNNVAISQ
ncbi:MAG TPA: hypothetical protein VIL84_00180 [Devosiaceae bacterium]